MYTVYVTSSYKKALKRVKKRRYDKELLKNIVRKLANGEALAPKHKDHLLVGDKKGIRECHITPDWLLLYRIEHEQLILMLLDTGTHSDLFD